MIDIAKPKPKAKPAAADENESRGNYYRRFKEQQAENAGPVCPRCKERLDDESKLRKHILSSVCRPAIFRAYPFLQNLLTK